MSRPLFLAARAVVNAEDPIGLLAMDAPEDEYDPEVRDLVGRRTALTAREVDAVFVHWSGAEHRLSEDTAQRIADGINHARSRFDPGLGQVPVRSGLRQPPLPSRGGCP